MEEKVPWWKRFRKGVQTSTEEKKETPEGVWHKCTNCKATMLTSKLKENLDVCPECNYHEKIDAEDYFRILYGDAPYEELFDDLIPKDFLKFVDLKPYQDRIETTMETTGLREAIRVTVGYCDGHRMVVAAMDFKFIGGSMGSVMGQKIASAIDYCLEHKLPLLIISKTGGARMQESAFSLMQMAKTATKLNQLADAKLPYISLLTNPTTGGVTASFAMLLSCMDLRLIDNIVHFMVQDNMTNRYDQYITAGVSLGLEKNSNWRQSFFDHLKLACDLHDVQDVYILEHRNCGAYEKLLGKEGEFGTSENEQKRERLVHKKHADKLKKDIEKWAKENEYKLTVQNFLMDLRGGVDFLDK